MLDGLLAYTQRHMARVDRLRRSVALLDYTLGAMRVVSPQETAAAAAGAIQALPAAAAQPPAGEPAPAPVAAAAPQAPADEAAVDLEPHSSESDLTAATGLERPVGADEDEDDIDLEEIDIRSIERVSSRMVPQPASPEDEADSRDKRQASAAGPSTTAEGQELPDGEGAEEGHVRRRKKRKSRRSMQEDAAPEVAAAEIPAEHISGRKDGEEEQDAVQEMEEAASQQKKKQKKHKTQKKQSGAETGVQTRRAAAAAKENGKRS